MSVIGVMDALAHRWRCCSPPPDHSPSCSFSITSSLELLINYKTSVFRSSSHDLPTLVTPHVDLVESYFQVHCVIMLSVVLTYVVPDTNSAINRFRSLI